MWDFGLSQETQQAVGEHSESAPRGSLKLRQMIVGTVLFLVPGMFFSPGVFNTCAVGSCVTD